MTLYTIVRNLLNALPAGSKRFLVRYTGATMALSVLDIVSLGLLAVVLPGMISNEPTTIPVLGVTISEVGQYTVILAIIAGAIVLKSLLNMLVVRIGTRRFANHEVAIGDKLFAAYMSTPWVERLRMNSADIVRSVDAGVNTTVYGVLIPASSLAGEIVSTAAVLLVLTIAQPSTAALTIVYLGLIALFLSRVITRKAVLHGRRNREYSFYTSRLITEAVATLKEITLRGATAGIGQAVHGNRLEASRSRATLSFLSVVPRYILESALIVGFILVGGMGWITGGQTGAVSAIALFAVAGFRIVPSLTRFQAILSQMHSNASFAELVLDEIAKAEQRKIEITPDDTAVLPPASERDITLNEVSFSFPDADSPALDRVSMNIPAGSHVAIVGASGAGKSTLVDILLGLLIPTSGTITVGQQPLTSVLNAWRASIGYVPQEVALFDASIAQNVALSWDPAHVEPARVVTALDRAQLSSMVDAREGGVEAPIGERGMALSGGQRQRLGIARALYPDPGVLVMDEATSALDTATEAAVTQAIKALVGHLTVITVAHRLATIRHADIVFFFKDGRLEASGTFQEVVNAVPDFAAQAALAGLSPEAQS
ncbi:ATP-binding cassette, subfamily C [Cryobacterium psychrotolerans]|uniref:ATP-binding cassette, subfamily C n=1 Tax=Cryobacterium psychrotolerans TaxID=386301 RepID=A0A1G9CIE5_9MICO|nr:ABC transporter ATP-binding protein [Cryobacterium psychrotolerans]TFD84273.1 ABC transporter ATP-binding protein [Cryobacterium psychrotolerans]SDK51427.1 ATP-binding cassette, subfamily C [Cryobacterium psychrotolerans]